MSPQIFQKLSLITTTVMISTLVYAGDANNPDWQYDVAPYLWAINLNGTVSLGPVTSHISESFSDLMKHFDGGGMLWLDAYKGRLGIFLNGLYTDLSDHGHIRSTDASVDTHFGLASAGFSYIVLQKPLSASQIIQVEPYFGARYTFNNVGFKLGEFDETDDHDWIDTIIGLRLRDDINSHWAISLAGDVGGRDPHTQYSYNLMGLIGYRAENPKIKNMTFYLGYRYLYEHYETGHGVDFFEWNMKMFGPLLGVNFNL